ncbi:hypothetical protein [Flavilitoribacter nigricans]|uniref:Superoxide dismutase copper/zinc binding domain-containing protein n=1 Tax=Flavilitoribacter nigricans (strain ATCC 23147 / DSM 23189 / NBRC 102662 / NCIMB 1420 / SS-2) TaxID=1122177 RepID=A0A2D0MXZ8_FLAN2|nr:hypothetical protein [Flavilitoribacter nigricans]PHN01008.1 hypothetical protein CRP01_39415 [Flavilitoribacter nigricans DSM 23189 = NBRC 102662]
MKTLRILLLFAVSFSLMTACEKEKFTPADDASGDAELVTRAHKGPKTKIYTAELGMLNMSGAMATVTVADNPDGSLTVMVEASGLEANMVHPQHIHGFADNTRPAVCPDESADTNEDGIIDLGEGVPFYGGVLLSLTDEEGNFPMADENGDLMYERTFSAEMVSSLKVLQNREIVLHGGTVMDEYWPTLPVACGSLGTPDIYPVGASGRR